ncbi:hypothetical protein WOLCODRAFT_91112 [Wolfiporia cocos MD-104 SS10]|uniref:Xylanolytic transcriptional activator regulatory domain-containing protein n=1 Tax=Wolfiporia cocos (strain MD-104) TaxID=742152 RepID=A0A2H3K4E0_WOLCO|nr:hypothetical protein WOLCODRAFT_91112 [Wolfiporia cocos MD-104 SS10]
MRCDGARPICGPCIRTNREADCEYTDGTTRSPTQVLEDNIVSLEARIHELEHPETVAPSVTLHDPHATMLQPGPSGKPTSPIWGRLDTACGSCYPSNSRGYGTNLAPLDSFVEPSAEVVQTLVGFFLPKASQIGFYLHQPRFLKSIYTQDAETRQARLSPALLNAVYLWGVHFSSNSSLLAHEPVFLQRAVHAVATALAHDPPYNIIYNVQAEILLANYFFSANRLLEGRYHCNAAVALALSCRLNKIRSQAHADLPAGVSLGVASAIPPPLDAIEEGERINVFWGVFILDKSWAVTVGSPSHFNGSPGAQVDTPWPLEMEEYEEYGIPQDLQGIRTTETFLAEMVSTSVDGTSSVALLAKSSALFERATRLASQWTPSESSVRSTLSPADGQTLAMAYVEQAAADFFLLDNVIDRYTALLLASPEALDHDAAFKVLLTRTFAYVATIRVHGILKQVEGLAQDKDLDAARAAVALIDTVNLTGCPFINPIMAILWTAICRVFIGEIVKLRIAWTSTSLLEDQVAAATEMHRLETDHDNIIAGLQKVLNAMTVFAQTCPLMIHIAVQANKIRQELENATR